MKALNPFELSNVLTRWIVVGLLACCPALTLAFGFQPQAYHLVDDKTGEPLVRRPDGQPEAFISAGGELLYLGFFTKTQIKQDDPEPGRQYADTGIGSRFKLRGEDRWVRVEKWCCDEYNWTHSQDLPGWREFNRSLSDRLKAFGTDEFGRPIQLKLSCAPLVYAPVFLFDPATLRPRWVKFYAVARKGADMTFKQCDRQEWQVYSVARIGSSLDSESTLIRMQDANSIVQLLQVSASTGEITGPNPDRIKAIDVEDVIRFKDQYLRDHPCPLNTRPEDQPIKERVTPAFTFSPYGKCILNRYETYDEAVMRHFFGQPAEDIY